MELSVRRLNNSLSTNKERLHAHSQVHTQTPKKEEKKNKAKKQKKQNKQTPNPIMETDCQNSLFYLLSLSLFLS